MPTINPEPTLASTTAEPEPIAQPESETSSTTTKLKAEYSSRTRTLMSEPPIAPYSMSTTTSGDETCSDPAGGWQQVRALVVLVLKKGLVRLPWFVCCSLCGTWSVVVGVHCLLSLKRKTHSVLDVPPLQMQALSRFTSSRFVRQCGGHGWEGSTCCRPGYQCDELAYRYSQVCPYFLKCIFADCVTSTMRFVSL